LEEQGRGKVRKKEKGGKEGKEEKGRGKGRKKSYCRLAA